jgi:hypothetical protein
MTDPYHLFRQIEHLLRQQEQIQRLAASSLVHDTLEQLIRELEQRGHHPKVLLKPSLAAEL